MSEPFAAIRQAVQELVTAEWENLRAGVHRPGTRRATALRQRDERMATLRGLLAQALQQGISAGFRGETVEERLSAVGRTAEAVTNWDRTMSRREWGAVGYLDPALQTEWHIIDSPDDQAEEHLADLATRATTALQSIQNLEIAANPKNPTQQVFGQHTIDHGSIIIPQGMTGGQVAHTIINLNPQAVAASESRHDQLVFRFHDFSASFMGQDSYGGTCPVKLTDAKWVQYWVRVDIYNARLTPIGLMEIYIVFSRDGKELLREVPGKHTGEVRTAQPYCPRVTSVSLPSNAWTSEIFRGALCHEQFKAVSACDEIALVATTVDQIAYRFRLSNGISEP